jgi:competence protein ComEC
LEAPRRVAHGCRAVARVDGPQPGNALLLGPPALCDWLPGDLGLARLQRSEHRPPSNPGARDAARSWRRRGVPTAARVEGRALLRAAGAHGAAARLERLRRRVGAVLDAPGPARSPPSDPPARAETAPVAGAGTARRSGALLRALVTGDRSGLSAGTRSSFERAGTLHLLAISGLHVGWVFALTRFCVSFGLRRSRRRALLRRAPALGLLAGMSVSLGYAALSGLGVPALRAVLMAWVGAAAVLGGRPGTVWNGLALSATAVLVLEPAALFEPGPWLSFGAVGGILLWRPAGSAVARLLGCTLGAGLATAPLLACLGAPMPAGSLLANGLAVPWFGCVVVPLGLAYAALGSLLGAPVPVLGQLAHASAELGIRLIAQLESPDLLAGLERPVAVACAAAGLAYALRALTTGRRALTAVALALGLGAALAALSDGVTPRAGTSLLFLDVGHGDAVLARSGDEAWLLDAGPGPSPRAPRGFDAGRSVVLPALRSEGVRRLERLVLTHADLDHVGGARSVLERMPVGELWMTHASYRDRALAPLRRAAARRGVPIRLVARGAREPFGPARVHVLWPPAALPQPRKNAGSIVLRLDVEDACALLPGDVPGPVERALATAAGTGRCGLLKLSHHGSASSSDPAFLDRVDADVAVASAGRRRRGTLPHPDVRARLRRRDVTLWVTRDSGALRVDLGRDGTLVAPFRSEPPLGYAATR